MQQKRKKYVPKEDKEFVSMMLDIARRPGEKATPSSRTNANPEHVKDMVEKLRRGEDIRKPVKKKS